MGAGTFAWSPLFRIRGLLGRQLGRAECGNVVHTCRWFHPGLEISLVGSETVQPVRPICSEWSGQVSAPFRKASMLRSNVLSQGGRLVIPASPFVQSHQCLCSAARPAMLDAELLVDDPVAGQKQRFGRIVVTCIG